MVVPWMPSPPRHNTLHCVLRDVPTGRARYQKKPKVVMAYIQVKVNWLNTVLIPLSLLFTWYYQLNWMSGVKLLCAARGIWSAYDGMNPKPLYASFIALLAYLNGPLAMDYYITSTVTFIVSGLALWILLAWLSGWNYYCDDHGDRWVTWGTVPIIPHHDIHVVDHVPYASGEIEDVESSYFAHAEYVTHMQFFPDETGSSIRESLNDHLEPYLGQETLNTLTRVVARECQAKHIVLAGILGTTVRVDVFGKR